MTTTKKSQTDDPTLPDGAVKEETPEPAPAAEVVSIRPVDFQYDDPSTYPVVTMPPASVVGSLGEV
jgi:hypothetical protein